MTLRYVLQLGMTPSLIEQYYSLGIFARLSQCDLSAETKGYEQQIGFRHSLLLQNMVFSTRFIAHSAIGV